MKLFEKTLYGIFGVILLQSILFSTANGQDWTQAYFESAVLEQEYGTLSHYFFGIARSKKSQEKADELALKALSDMVRQNISTSTEMRNSERNKRVFEFYSSRSSIDSENILVGVTITKRAYVAHEKQYYALAIINKEEYYENLEKGTSSSFGIVMESSDAVEDAERKRKTIHNPATRTFLNGRPSPVTTEVPLSYPQSFVHTQVGYLPFFAHSVHVGKSFSRVQATVQATFDASQNLRKHDAGIRYFFLMKNIASGSISSSFGIMTYSGIINPRAPAPANIFPQAQFSPQLSVLYNSVVPFHHRLNIQVDRRQLALGSLTHILPAFGAADDWLFLSLELLVMMDNTMVRDQFRRVVFTPSLQFKSTQRTHVTLGVWNMRYPTFGVVLR